MTIKPGPIGLVRKRS